MKRWWLHSAITASVTTIGSRVGSVRLAIRGSSSTSATTANPVKGRYDSRALTAPARAAFLARFELLVDPEGVLPPEERERRAQQARRAHFKRLALLSSRARSRQRECEVGEDGAAPPK